MVSWVSDPDPAALRPSEMPSPGLRPSGGKPIAATSTTRGSSWSYRWYAVQSKGGWGPFCEYFTGFVRRTLIWPSIAGCESIDPDGKSHRFTIPPRQER